ncbi:uncharacterized protein LOC133832891 [Humulus lupulus]|uniref:uncharacterized protein LOC133832891 n=1 Tax=Humulus lupulus TaxID=3486 RepID=UPI002B40C927|nr:uncharacterized protein LOC133832891 [Humulus lupulus]
MNKGKIFKLAKGFRGRAKNWIRIARERVEKALQYFYRDFRNKKRDMRSLWIQRINAGTRQHGREIERVKDELKKEFEMKDLGAAKLILGCLEIRKSLTGYVLAVFGIAISWKANLQKMVALSTIEAEHIALTEVVKEAIWLFLETFPCNSVKKSVSEIREICTERRRKF